MLDTPRIIQTFAQTTAVIHLVIPRDQIQRVMGPTVGELMATLGAQGIAPVGPIFSHHHRFDPSSFDFDIGVPVATTPKPSGRVTPGQLPARRVAQTVYRGPYESLGQAWEDFGAWVAANGHTPAPDLWERYLSGPESNPDPSMFRTELNRPLAG